MAKDKLRWGVLGVASIYEQVGPAIARACNAELRAIASRSLDRARQAAQIAQIPTAYGSYDELVHDPDIDAVYIPLPNSMHAEWTRKVAGRGKHVLCEKPLTPTAAEAQSLVEYCRSQGVCLMDGFMWPHHPRTARIRALLDSGAIGQVRHVRTAFTFRMMPLDPASIHLQAHLGSGGLLDAGCYPVFGIRWAFAAEPVRALATAHYEFGVDVEMSGMMWLADGRSASFDCGFTLPNRQWLEIVGTEGIIRVPEMWLPPRRATFTLERAGQPPEEIAVDGEDQIQRMIEDFGRAALQGTAVSPPPEEGVRTLRVLDALAQSAREGG